MNKEGITDIKSPNTDQLTLEIVKSLWTKTYNTAGKPDWSHILPYYADDVVFKDTIQEIRGIDDFKAMTERLSKRSSDLKMKLIKVFQNENDIFIEWEMTISFKNIQIPLCMGPQDSP